MFGEPTRGRAVREARAFYGASGCRLDYEAVDHRLELLPMADVFSRAPSDFSMFCGR